MDDSEPEPDATVVSGTPRDYTYRHPVPTDISLIVEVADSSLQRDRQQKRRIYARNGIPIYWIVNVVDRVIEVHSSPSGPDRRPTILPRSHFVPGTCPSFRWSHRRDAECRGRPAVGDLRRFSLSQDCQGCQGCQGCQTGVGGVSGNVGSLGSLLDFPVFSRRARQQSPLPIFRISG